MKGIYHPSPNNRERRGKRGEKQRPKKEKTKKRYRPDFTRCDAEWSGKNAHSFRFCFVWRDAGGYPVKRRCAKPNVMGWSRGIRCSSCTPRGRCSREIRVSITLVGVVGIGVVASRVRGAAEGVHVTIASPMALASLAGHVAVRESVVKAGWWMVRDMRRNREPALRCG